MDQERYFWLAMSAFPGIGPVRFGTLWNAFGSAKALWQTGSSDLRRAGLNDRLVREFIEFRRTFSPQTYALTLRREGVWFLTKEDPQYPALLGEISDAPFVLYGKGKRTDIPIDLTRTIAVVGTRKVTAYGRDVTRRLVEDLAVSGCTIVSGLAYGVDAVAHEAAIAAGGKTIAVLGCGVDVIAPASNAKLYERIVGGGGAVISEMPLGMRPNKGLFPARNRIISGLSLGVVVTEGASDSGALITARCAAEQGREVFAVPGPVTSSLSRGPARLLKDGARLVESAADILLELGLQANSVNATNKQARGETKEEQKILDVLAHHPVSVDELIQTTGLQTAVVSATLTILEMKGVVKEIGDNVYGIV